ncbi:MAG: sigma-54-dependent Fis family transcriptional regulator [Lentisphaerae bacterium]|nr:sigma-54-dependent Fis family transcriptional regulator [Lentisphaerota bacterium]
MLELTGSDRELFRKVERIVGGNPFSEVRSELDRSITGLGGRSTRDALVRASMAVVAGRMDALNRGRPLRYQEYGGEDGYLLQTAVLYHVFHRYIGKIDELIVAQEAAGEGVCRVAYADELLSELVSFGVPSRDALRFLAIFFQLRRAYYYIDRGLKGRSDCMKQLRCELWQNVFTENVRIYDRFLWGRMEDFSTLLLGETGTGKGTAAAAIGRSGFIPYDTTRGCFKEGFPRAFVSLNLSQFPEGLIESELFGHRKGAFTGAVDQHQGVLALCSPHGAVFLDEIGDVSVPVQIKLLQVLQERTFSPVGSHEEKRFAGRVIAATNRSLEALREQGAFREDFYYRLSSDRIVMPPLRRRFREDRRELDDLVGHILKRLGGEAGTELAEMTCERLRESVAPTYAWPGNVRELEQAVRSVLLRGRYEPARGARVEAAAPEQGFLSAVAAGSLDARELVETYCAHLYAQLGSYGAVARQTGLDWRTVKKHVHAPQARGG